MKLGKLCEDKWSSGVESKWTPPEGFFDQSSGKIADGLKGASKDLKQAMARLMFYINRAGDKLDAKALDRLEGAKEKLKKLYGE